jgi:sugar/nucleoside kinase (ribokinase family)
MKVVGPCMPHIDYFMPSYEEAVRLAGGETAPERIADAFLALGAKTAVIKLGKDGCYAKDSRTGAAFYAPTYLSVKPVDTTGAGDAFCAGFIAGLARGLPLEGCAALANAVGTFCVTAMGASTGVKGLGEVEAFMAANTPG